LLRINGGLEELIEIVVVWVELIHLSLNSQVTTVTTPPEIIPYYPLNHSIWSLSDNIESSR
jgi:hypothetical protein